MVEHCTIIKRINVLDILHGDRTDVVVFDVHREMSKNAERRKHGSDKEVTRRLYVTI